MTFDAIHCDPHYAALAIAGQGLLLAAEISRTR